MLKPIGKTQDKSSDAVGGEIVEAEGRKVAPGERATLKDVKNEGRSGNVYENKGPNDTMTDNYSGFCAGLASFCKNRGPSMGLSTGNAEITRQSCVRILATRRDDARIKIGPSVHGPIDPSAVGFALGNAAAGLGAQELKIGWFRLQRQAARP